MNRARSVAIKRPAGRTKIAFHGPTTPEWDPSPLNLCSRETPGRETPPAVPQMTERGASRPGPAPGDRTAIGITFGNSNSSIAYTVDDRAEVIANEDGGKQTPFQPPSPMPRLSR